MNPPKTQPSASALWHFGLGRLRSALICQIDLWFLVGFLAILNLRRISPIYVPIHDSMQVFQYFHFFYSSLLFHGEWPQWVPYGLYGMPADFWALCCLTPANVLLAVTGKLLGVTDAMLLFKASIALEEFTFLVGMYWLSRLLYKQRLTAWFVCLGAVSGLNWYSQLWWNFRIFYLVPAALACLLGFFRYRRPVFLWLAGVVYLTSMVGNLPYFAPIYLALNLPFVAVLTIKNRSVWKTLWDRPRGHLWLLAFLAGFAACYVAAVRVAMGPLVFVMTGRDASGGVDVRQFLQHGGRPDAFSLFRQALSGWPIFGAWNGFTPDQSIYVGLLPWFLVAWAALYVRRAEFFAVAGTTLLLAGLFAGGTFATFAYYAIPGMRLFRHVSELLALGKILFLLTAGFGLDDFIRRGRAIHLLLMAGCLIFLADQIGRFEFVSGLASLRKGFDGSVFALLAVRVLVYVAVLLAASLMVSWYRLRRGGPMPPSARNRMFRLAATFLVVAYVVDMLSFRWLSDQAVPQLPPSLTDSIASLRASKVDFRDRRTDSLSEGRVQQAERLLNFMNPWCTSGARENPYIWPSIFRVQLNHLSYAFLHHDPCESNYFVPVYARNIWELLEARDRDPAFSRVLGCESPKLRLVSRAVFVDGTARANEAVETTAAIDEVVIIPRKPTAAEAVTASSTADRGEVRVLDFSANSLEIEVDRPGSDPTWLVYSDSYHPDWYASVNGSAVPIEAAYGAFKAVKVPPGTSIVQFRFWGLASWNLAVAVTVLGTLCWLGLIGIILFQSPRRPESRLAN